ncbi:MAG: tetratricopeptide repeat protein [Nitrospirae bacterium]|nr:tetratricopeptide repeat protein [Nitrospirota bacterium]
MAVILSFVCFIPDLNNELLIWDDSGYIIDNVYIRNLSFETVSWAFTTFYCNYWAPLTWLSYAVDYAVWGLNPVGYHLTNNALHALNTGMFFLLSLELLQIYLAVTYSEVNKARILNNSNIIYCSLMAALFFGLHPLRVESVAWAAERKDVLSFFFGIPAIFAYLRYTRMTVNQIGSAENQFSFLVSRYYWLAIGFYCLSLLSKSMLVTLPLVLLVLDWFPLRRVHRKTFPTLLLEKIPLVVLAGFAAVITMFSQTVEMIPLERSDMPSRMLNALKSIMAYLRLTVWPLDLSPFYLHPGNITKLGMEYTLPIFFFVAVTICCVLTVKRRPVFTVTWLIYLITLLPVIGITAVGPTAMAARFTYLPGLPLAMLAALGITVFFVRFSGSYLVRILIGAGTFLLLLLGCYCTIQQISFWKDDVTLWTRAIDLQPNTVGRVYFQRGIGYGLKGEFQKALTDMNKAVEIATAKGYGEMHTIYFQRAWILRQLGDLEAAIADLSSALLTDNSPMRQLYYRERGTIYQELGRTDLANEDFRLSMMPEGSM